jgi:hypothetical protein
MLSLAFFFGMAGVVGGTEDSSSSFRTCTCSGIDGFLQASDQSTILRVCLYPIEVNNDIIALMDLVADYETHDQVLVQDGVPVGNRTQVVCLASHCDISTPLEGGVFDETSLYIPALFGNITGKNLVDESGQRWETVLTSFRASPNLGQDAGCSQPPQQMRSSKSIAVVLIAFVLFVIICCYGIKFKASEMDIPL